MDIGEIIAIVAAVGALIGSVLAWRKTPHETKEIDSRTEGQDADTISKYQVIADRAAERALKLEKRVDDLECEVAKLKEENRQTREENLDLRDWADRLVHQVKSLGGDPVRLRIKADRQGNKAIE